MSDITQGQDVTSDTDLFRDAVETTTLEKFENPELPPREPDKQADKAADKKPTDKPADAPEDREAIPAWVLREQKERARQAEQDNADLRARLAALERQPPQAPKPAPDLFENPSAFVQHELDPRLQKMHEEIREQVLAETREENSRFFAMQQFGAETVHAARMALEQGIRAGDPHVKLVLDTARASRDPYGVITRWHRDRAALEAMGGDPEAYRKKVLEEALNDPEYRKRALEAERTQARGSGNNGVFRPAQPRTPTSPSLANFGSGGGDEAQTEPSDDQLFRQAVSAKRR